MRRSVLVLCVLGFAFLIVGSVLASPSARNGLSKTIHNFGTIAVPDGSPEQVDEGTGLDLLGYVVALSSVGFFAAAFLRNKRLV